MRSSYYYQMTLIFLGIVSTVFFGVFVYREVFPEYRIYQNDYIALEKFRSTYTHASPVAFKEGVKQILIEVPDNGPPIIDRCTSCHVALDIPYFSPTKIAFDVNGNMLLNEKGEPVKIPNEDYIWGKLEERIAALTDPKVNEQLKSEGETAALASRLKEAEELKALMTVQVGENVYDVKKVLAMHPLIGRETRPFENHPMSDYGCTSCHGGNGRALTTDKAHGPVFDDQYEIEYRGPEPKFLETDVENDPQFSREFNHKPGDALVFQTTPILVGDLIEAKCMQCHQSSKQSILGALDKTTAITNHSQEAIAGVAESYQKEIEALASLLKLQSSVQQQGVNKTVTEIQQQLDNYLVPPENRKSLESQLNFLVQGVNKDSDPKRQSMDTLQNIQNKMLSLVGSSSLVQKLVAQYKGKQGHEKEIVEKFIQQNISNPEATGSLFLKANTLELEQDLLHHIRETENSFSQVMNDQRLIGAIQTDVDRLTTTYQRGMDLYVQQACYACHRISGFARGGVGPELTKIGKNYPWYIKHHIVWPQGDLPTSTMPNFRLDHEELEPLMTFLLAQRGQNEAISKSEHKRQIAEWENGKELSFEKPITPAQMYDLRYSMIVFATEGCAACHRLKGFESNVGYRVEKEKKNQNDFETLYREREWFTSLFPEELLGSQIVEVLDKYSKEIDEHIVDGVRKGSILEEIEAAHPQDIEAFYTNFRFANRAKNHHYEELASKENDPAKRKQILDELEEYKKRLHRVLMVYIQEYGLGRLIGPRPNWSGIYRSDAWLMEHFRKPTAHVARSIMPVFPFDDTKFYALTHMLDVLGKQNRDWDRQLWEHRGFNPAVAYQLHCSQCHGEYLAGNGPVSNWIYPVPKNLRNAEFLRNYTQERVIDSITHGVKGTPMPPWGEVAPGKSITADGIPVLTKSEIHQLAEWLFSTLPGSTIIPGSQEVPKWNYQPEDVIKELHEEGGKLEGKDNDSHALLGIVDGRDFFVALEPTVPQRTAEDDISRYFDRIPNPPGKPDKNSYYIKRKYYTDENIAKGKAFFDIYCAVCHGAEADGTGARAAVMQEAKPRMLTNLDWLETHDDIYLLRSIKYGVPGTSMTPWGDQTSSLLRMQLVMFIRSLSEDTKEQQQFNEALYNAFDTPDFQIDTARVNEVKEITKVQEALQAAQSLQKKLYQEAQTNPSLQKEAVEAYQQQLLLSEKLNQETKKDDYLVQLKTLLAKEKKIYKELGSSLLASKIDGEVPQTYLKVLHLLNQRYTLKDDRLVLQSDKDLESKMDVLKKKMIAEIQQKLTHLKDHRILISARIHSFERDKELKEVDAEILSLTNYQDELEKSFQEAHELRNEQANLMDKIK